MDDRGNTTTMIMISKDVISIYAGGLRSYARGGLFAAGGGLFAGGPFAAGLIAGGLFASGLNAAPRVRWGSAFSDFFLLTMV